MLAAYFGIAACVWHRRLLTKLGAKENFGGDMSGTGFSLVWQGWDVLSVMAVLTALLGTILAWLLPFPERSLSVQLANHADRIALKARLGTVPPFRAYLLTLQRLNVWMMDWFGPSFSGQAFERCLAIAFIFPIVLFLVTLIAHGVNKDSISLASVGLFALAFTVIAYVIVAAFRNLLGLIRHTWTRFGGDEDTAQTISQVLLGAFAVMVAFTISFTIATTFQGQESNASSVLGAMAGGFALAFALAIAFALAGATLFSIAVAILAGAALAFASKFAFLLFLFFVLLPVVNACVDWLSWGSTRFLLKQAETAGPDLVGGLKVIGAILGTFVAGAILMIMLSALLPNVMEGLNHLFALAHINRFEWQPLVAEAVKAPWTDGLFVTGMLMTAIVPASAHMIVGLTGMLARLTPGARTAAETISEHSDIPLSPGEEAPVKLTLIFSHIWYLVSAAITIAFIATAGWLISYTHAPVADFLSDVAHCATSWSHGQCVWY